ncbi:hypothetical protein R3W88_003058 [Solanum pinnatisectum]|uniref:Uncharacterized protein n=1 Tax=Solanum pinnatisectum TaxID=50273 RepID=A0AAV9MMX5_9SOLN|nr:hypothetical protein R3W88_003058 [Solanum pinnatisectum]
MDMMRPYSQKNKYQIAKTRGGGETWYSNPEFNRKKRVAKYKIYSMEGKVKRSFKNGITKLTSIAISLDIRLIQMRRSVSIEVFKKWVLI